MDADLFVIGGGSAGVRAARVAAEHGAKVVIAEEDRWGGTCVVRGCIPKKLMVYAAELGGDLEDARAYGWQVGAATCDMAALADAVGGEVERLSRGYAARLERAGVQLVRARARVVGPHAVQVDDGAGSGRRLDVGVILVATGGAPEPLEVPGRELAIDSDAVFRMRERPERMAVVGGGYIAVELAHVFRGLGSQVWFIHRGEQVLRGFDADVRAAVTAGLAARGMQVRLQERIIGISRDGSDALRVQLAGGDVLAVDAVLAAVGRRPRSAGFGLEEVGVELGPRGAIVVDEDSRTSVPSIYAVGDCTDRKALTPIAIREGQVFADAVFGGKPGRLDYDHVPTAVFALPPAAVVGLTETEARARCAEVDVYRAQFRPLRHTVSKRDQRTLMKLVVDGKTDKLLGAHIVGDDAPEIIQTLAVALRLGATKADLDATLPLHPTSAEELLLMRRAE
jgi:glutathione reductase (NADPH)